MKILVVQNKMGIGDMVIYLPFINAISKKFNTPVHILVKESSKAEKILKEHQKQDHNHEHNHDHPEEKKSKPSSSKKSIEKKAAEPAKTEKKPKPSASKKPSTKKVSKK